MAVKSPLEQILDKNKVQLHQLQMASTGWFQSQVKSMAGVVNKRPENLMRGDQALKSTSVKPGNLYMFIYNPKMRDTLPYYDTFPLVFPFSPLPDGFLGINLHYLPYTLRAQVMTALQTYRTAGPIDERTKLQLSWQKLQAMSKHKYIQPCVKHYLYSHVETPFKKVLAEDWATAMLLPVQQFKKANTAQVWAESIKRIR